MGHGASIQATLESTPAHDVETVVQSFSEEQRQRLVLALQSAEGQNDPVSQVSAAASDSVHTENHSVQADYVKVMSAVSEDIILAVEGPIRVGEIKKMLELQVGAERELKIICPRRGRELQPDALCQKGRELHFSIGDFNWPVLGPEILLTRDDYRETWIHTFNLASDMAAALSELIVGMVDKQANSDGTDFEKSHKAIMKHMRSHEDEFGSGWHCTIRLKDSEHARPAQYNEAMTRCGGHLQYAGVAVCIFQEEPLSRIVNVTLSSGEADGLRVDCRSISGEPLFEAFSISKAESLSGLRSRILSDLGQEGHVSVILADSNGGSILQALPDRDEDSTLVLDLIKIVCSDVA